MSSTEKKQNNIKFFVIGGAALFMLALILFSTKETDKKQIKKDIMINHTNLINEEEIVKSKWMGDVNEEVDNTKDSIKELKEENERLKSQLDLIQEKLKKIDNQPSNQPSTKKPIKEEEKTSSFPLPPNNSDYKRYIINGRETYLPDDFLQRKKEREKPSVKFTKLKDTLIVDEIKKNETEEEEKEIKKEPLEIIPTGSIIKTMLLSGFDAPTLAQAKTNPLPILMKVTDLSILPNRYKYDLRECFIMAEGYGDLSSERAYIRTNNLSCITNSGKRIDLPIKGMVTGEDGKVGLRGRVVSKQGTIIAQTIIATFVSNVAQAFGSKGDSLTTSLTNGTTTSTTADLGVKDTIKKGLYKGLSAGTNKLADFFLKMADQVSPVIEIDARREVEVIVTAPIILKTKESESEK